MKKRNQRSNSSLLAVVPVFGETEELFKVLSDLRSLSLETLVINDGNGPGLTKELRSLDHRVYDMGHNQGLGAATVRGLHIAAREGYKGIISVDADGAHNKVSVAEVAAAARFNLELPVLTVRFGHLGETYVPAAKKAANAFAAELFYAATGHRLSDVASGLRYYPVSLATKPWQEKRFGFAYEILRCILDASTKYRLIKTFVSYPTGGPHLTKANELADLVNFCLRAATLDQVTASKLFSLRNPSKVKKADAQHVTINNKSFHLNPVPSQESYLISESVSESETLQTVQIPRADRISLGLIPDGGRRWALTNGQTLKRSYLKTYSLISKFLSIHSQELDVIGIYSYSLYNMQRSKEELVALFDAVEEFTENMLPKDYSPVFYGDLSKLPQQTRRYTLNVNRKSSESSASNRLVVLCTLFSISWQRSLLSSNGMPWEFMLSPAVLQRILSMRFALLLRTGNAHTLSDFYPDAAAYAVMSFKKALFNDVDLEAWWNSSTNRLKRVKYGT